MNTDTTPATSGSPGRPGLSFEAYEQAYHELCGVDGSPPSQRQLRKFLGTGSNTTLAGYRRRIAEKRLEDELPPEAGTVDAELMALVLRLAKQIALDEAQVADDRVDEIQAAAEQRVRIAEATMEKRLQDTALLEHRANTAEAAVAEQRSELTMKDEKLAQIEAECQDRRESVAVLSQSLEDTTRQLASMTRQHDALQQTLTQARTDHLEATKQVQEKHLEQFNRVKGTLGESQTALADSKEECTGLKIRLEERDKLIETLTANQQALETRIEQSNELREASLRQLDDARQSLSEINSQLSAREAELQAEKHAHHVNAERLKSALKDVDDKQALTRQLQETLTKLTPGTAR